MSNLSNGSLFNSNSVYCVPVQSINPPPSVNMNNVEVNNITVDNQINLSIPQVQASTTINGNQLYMTQLFDVPYTVQLMPTAINLTSSNSQITLNPNSIEFFNAQFNKNFRFYYDYTVQVFRLDITNDPANITGINVFSIDNTGVVTFAKPIVQPPP